MIDLALLDKVNSLVEAGCGVPALLDCVAIVRQRSSNQTPLGNVVWFNLCGIWWAFYFFALGQYWTLVVTIFWCATYAVKTAFVIYYRSRRDHCQGQRAQA